MSKHTQGDWYTKREGYSTVYVFCRIGGGLVQEVAACGPTNEGQEQQEANARLIAAAPDLLEDLKKRAIDARQSAFEDWLSKESPSGDGEQVHRQWEASSAHADFVDEWGSALDAIAKATGEQA